MNIKKLTFTEVNLDGKNNHQWQGIMVYCDDLMIFHIHFYPKKNGYNDKSYFHITSILFPSEIFEYKYSNNKNFYDKEEVKKYVQEIFERIIIDKFLI